MRRNVYTVIHADEVLHGEWRIFFYGKAKAEERAAAAQRRNSDPSSWMHRSFYDGGYQCAVVLRLQEVRPNLPAYYKEACNAFSEFNQGETMEPTQTAEKTDKPKSVYDIKINRGKDGLLRCSFFSPALAKIACALANGKKGTLTVGERTIETWDCAEDLIGLAEEVSLEQSAELLDYADGKIKGINLAPLCAVCLGTGDGLVIEPTFPHSAASLDAYAKALRSFVRTVLAAVAPVEISVRLVTKK